MATLLKIFALTRRVLGAPLQNTVRNIVADIAVRVTPGSVVERPNCVSALIRVKNEEWWIRASILSIKDLVYEYVIMDASTDKTPEIIDKTALEYGLKVDHVIDFDNDIVEVGNRGLARTKCRWILRWDGDFVMKEEGVTHLKKLVDSLSRDMNYVVYWPHVCLDIDLKHRLKSLPNLHREHWLITYAPGTKFVKISRGFEYLYIPPYIAKRIEIDKPLSFHLRTVKPPNRLLLSKYWHDWLIEGYGHSSFEEFLQAKMVLDYGTYDIEESSKRYVEELKKDLVLVDREEYRELPSVLLREVPKELLDKI